MIFGGRLAVTGAREPEVLLSVIDRVAEMQAGGPQGEPDDEDGDEDDDED